MTRRIFSRMEHRIGHHKRALLILYMLALLFGSVIPMDSEIKGLDLLVALDPKLQNLFHIPLFAGLANLWLWNLNAKGKSSFASVKRVLFYSLLFGVVTELIQTLVPGRFPSLLDIGLNALGSVLGMVVFVARAERAGRA